MSVVGAVLTMFISLGIYIGVIFLNRTYNHGGRDPINPLYSISQWNPNKVEITGGCVVPQLPGNCVIEGMTGAYQAATHWCDVTQEGPCIDPDTGENVKNNPIPFQAVCSAVPYCSWSQGILTFDGTNYVAVNITPPTTPTGNPQISIQNVPASSATTFYMERLSVDGGLKKNQNGTIARFYFFYAGNVYVLSYTNSYTLGSQQVTALTVQRSNDISSPFLTMFVLAEAMPTTVSPNIPSAIVARKILVFGGTSRQTDPPLSELKDFNEHFQKKFWNAAIKYFLVMITATALQGPFYGFPTNTYQNVLNSWGSQPGTTLYLIQQDFVESRLSRSRERAFYNWVG